MQAGKLQHRIEIQRVVETVLASGHVDKDWTIYARGRAELRQASISEYLTGFGEADAGAGVFLIRWIPGVTTGDRIIHGGKTWNIVAIAEIGRRRGLELRAVAA